MSRRRSFTVVLEPREEGGFSASVPALPEVVSEGDSEDEVLAMVEDAIELALAHRRERNMHIPEDMAPTVRKVSVSAA